MIRGACCLTGYEIIVGKLHFYKTRRYILCQSKNHNLFDYLSMYLSGVVYWHIEVFFTTKIDIENSTSYYSLTIQSVKSSNFYVCPSVCVCN